MWLSAPVFLALFLPTRYCWRTKTKPRNDEA
jgi:hypothetical protein